MGPRPNGRGKGRDRGGGRGRPHASMGPRPNGRGKVENGANHHSARRGVNGAAAKRPRKDPECPACTDPVQGVNGAAAKRPRKGLRFIEGGLLRLRQWGRGQTAAESSCSAAALSAHVPRQWGRGQTAAESWQPKHDVAIRRSVNGAAAKRPRKGYRSCPLPTIQTRRQWGRGQTAAERRPTPRSRAQSKSVNGAAAKRPRKESSQRLSLAAVGSASMGPRPNGRGKTMAIYLAYRNYLASMGPRPNGRGKLIDSSRELYVSRRQWGRGQTAAESPPCQ